MAMDWLDAARYADTNGYQNDFARTMWPWRDWVIAAFNRNQPFDRFIIEQIAGDLLPGATLEQKIATGFNRNNRTVTEAGSIDEEWRIENAVDRVETTATVFLGLTMGCARCHDHKYDPISQKEFYQFLAFFNSINEKGVYTEQRGNVPPLISRPQSGRRTRNSGGSTRPSPRRRRHATRPSKGLAQRRKRLGAKASEAAGPARSRDWSLRCPLDGDLHVPGARRRDRRGDLAGRQAGPRGPTARWARPCSSTARTDSFVEVERGVEPRPDRSVLLRRLDQARWRRRLPEQDGRPGRLPRLRPPDRGRQGRGPSRSLLAGRRAQGPITREALPQDAWTHVFVTL